MILLDLFSGIGGFHKGFLQAGFNFTKTYFSEVDKYAQSIYERQFSESIRLGDVTKVSDGLGKIDIITGGFPCQAFSIAGKRQGFNDIRGTLFFDVVRLAKIYKPRYMVLENVKGLLSHERGDTIKIILDELRRLDYNIQMLLLNTKDFNVPQNRERVFFICTARGERRPEIFRIRERKTEIACMEITKKQSQGYRTYDVDGSSVCLASQAGGVGAKTGLYAVISKKGDIKRGDTHASTLTAGGHSGGNHSDMDLLAIPVLSPDRTEKRQNGRRFKTNGEPAFTLTAQDRHGILIKSATKKGYEIAKNGDSINYSVLSSKTRRGRVGKQLAQTLDTSCNQASFDGINIRRLTPIECERLQGFPDNFTKYGVNNETISDSQRYKCLGNSVTVDIIEEIAKEIKAVI